MDTAATYADMKDCSMNLIMKPYRRKKSPRRVSAMSNTGGGFGEEAEADGADDGGSGGEGSGLFLFHGAHGDPGRGTTVLPSKTGSLQPEAVQEATP